MARPKKQLTDAEAVKMRDVEAYTHDDKFVERGQGKPASMCFKSGCLKSEVFFFKRGKNFWVYKHLGISECI